ncbi:MAG: hypothetical protein L3J66_03355 [Bacteroidales bacterium]|nr:hypothetical protein [Bacteroidales bacterium]
MKKLAPILLFVLANSLIGQNIWEPIIFPDTLKSKAINAEKEGVLFVATGGNNEYYGLFRTLNYGNTWELIEVDTASSYVSIFTIRYNSDDVLFIGANSRIYRSVNDGESFEKVLTGVDNILKINFSPGNEIFAVGWSYIFRSTDAGTTWDTLYHTNSNLYFADIDFGLNGEIYTVGGSFDGPGTGSGFHRSLDNGISWENIGIVDLHLHCIEVNTNGVIIVGGEGANMYRSNDNGENWTYISDYNASAIESDFQDNLFAGVRGFYYDGVLLSEDWGSTWSELNDTVLNPYINQISISPNNTVYLQCDKVVSEPYQLFKSINPILGIKSENSAAEITLFPNPTDTKISISNKTNKRILRCNIYNQNGP